MNKVWTAFNFITPNTSYKTKLGNIHNFKEWVNSAMVVEYITRKDKCVTFNENENNYDAMKLMMDKNEKLDWYHSHLKMNQNNNQSGLYNLLNEKPIDVELDKVKKELKNLKSNFWELIVNPGDLALENNILCKDKWHEVLQENFKRFLKANKFESDNLNIYYSIHGNTNYPHVHMFWYEKEPKRKKAKLDVNSINVFAYKVGLSIKYDEDYQKINKLTKGIWDTRKQITEIISGHFNNNTNLSTNNLNKLFIKASKSILDELDQKKNISYMRLSDENKTNIEIIKDFLLTSDNDYSRLFNSYQKQIKELNELNIEDKFLKEKIKKIIDKEIDEFKKQVGNKIIKSLLKAYEENNKNAFKSASSFGNFFRSFMNIFAINRSEQSLRNLAEREFLAKNMEELEMVEEIYRGKLR